VFKVIVVGTDGSARSGIAVEEALALPKLSKGRVHGVHVLRPLLTTATAQLDAAGVAVANGDRKEEAQRIRAEFLAEATRHRVPAELETHEDDPADALIKAAEAVEADLLVVGKPGHVRRPTVHGGQRPQPGVPPQSLQSADRRHRPVPSWRWVRVRRSSSRIWCRRTPCPSSTNRSDALSVADGPTGRRVTRSPVS